MVQRDEDERSRRLDLCGIGDDVGRESQRHERRLHDVLRERAPGTREHLAADGGRVSREEDADGAWADDSEVGLHPRIVALSPGVVHEGRSGR